MGYKEKYEQALRRAKKLLEDMDKKDYFASNGDIENIFPELSQESEDERIRKAIVRILKGETGYISKEDTDRYIAWLEKQGENKKLDPDKVIAWIVANICDFEYYVKWFKKDFGL